MNDLAQEAQQAAAAVRYLGATDERERVERRRRAQGTQVADSQEQIEARFGRLLKTGQVPPEAIEAAVATSESVRRHVLLERIIGATNDLQPVKFLAKGATTVRSIARIGMDRHGVPAPRGTGFLVSPRLLMTNNHVLRDPAEAARAIVEFNYEVGEDDRPAVVATHRLDPDTLFLTDPVLDYTLVMVRPDEHGSVPGAVFGWNRLVSEQGKVVNGESINVVGHPMGRLKEIAIRNGALQYQHDDFLNYTTDTEHGSSGSPVFNDQWEVVALHHASIPSPGPTSDPGGAAGHSTGNGDGAQPARTAAFVNEGARVSVLIRHIMQQSVSDEQRVLLGELSRPVELANGTGRVDTNGAGNGNANGNGNRTFMRMAAPAEPHKLERAVVARNGAHADPDHKPPNGTADVMWVYGLIPVPMPGQTS